MLLRTSLAMLFAWAPLSLVAAHGQPAQPSGVTALTHVRVIDGTGRAPLEDATVVIQGNQSWPFTSGCCGPCRCAGTGFAWRYGDAWTDQCPWSSGFDCRRPELGYGLHRGKRARRIAAVRELRCHRDVIPGAQSRSSLPDSRAATAGQARWRYSLHGRPRDRRSGRRASLACCARSALPAGDAGRSPRWRWTQWPSGTRTWSRSGSTAWEEPNPPCRLRSTVR